MGALSNYRVREVLALGAMPDRQLRLLIALATWMNDESRVVRAGFATLVKNTGNAENTVKRARRELEAGRRVTSEPGRGRGNLTVWTVWCLAEKGGSEADPVSVRAKQVSEFDPFPAVDNSGKGVKRAGEKGSNGLRKRGQAQRGDQRERDRGLNLIAKPSLRPAGASLHAALAAVVPDVTERETALVLDVLKRRSLVQSPEAVLPTEIGQGNGPALVAQVRRQSVPPLPLRGDWCGQCSDETARQVTLPDGRVSRCPRCHPLRRGESA